MDWALHAWRREDRLRTVALALAGALLAYKGGQMSALQGTAPLLAVLLVLAVWGMTRRPDLAVIAVLVLGATVIQRTLIDFTIGPIQTDLVELASFGLIGMWLLGRIFHQVTGTTSFALPLAIIAASTAVGAMWSILQGTTQSDIQGSVKTLVLYLLVLPVSAFFPGQAGKARLERIIVLLASLGSLYTIWVAALGADVINGGRYVDQSVLLLGQTLDAQRIRYDVLALVFIAVLLVTGRVAAHGHRPLWIAQLALFTVVIAFSFNRSTWLPLTATVLLMLLLRPGRRAPLRGARTGLAGGVVIVVIVSAAAAGALGPTGRAITERASSTVDPRVLTEDSYKERSSEDRAALDTLAAQPVLGTGIARPYGFRKLMRLTNPAIYVYAERPFIHNQYLAVWLQLGLLGLLGFFLLGVQVVRSAIRAVRTLPQDPAIRALAGGLAMLGIAMQGWFQTSLYFRPSILAVACSLALLEQRSEPSPSDDEALSGAAAPRAVSRP